MVMRESATVHVSDHAFGAFDQYEIPIQTADWSNGLVVAMSSGAMVYTGIDRGNVRVTVELRDDEPSDIDPGPWDDIVEASVQSPHGELRVHLLEYGPVDLPPPLPLLSHHGPGPYRLRAYVRGRDLHFDAVREESEEDYLLLVWPADPRPALIIRATDHCGYGLRLASLKGPGQASHAGPVQPSLEQQDRARLRQALLDGAAKFEAAETSDGAP